MRRRNVEDAPLEPLRCPAGDQMHPTDDPRGGACSGCLAWQEEMRQEWYEDQTKAFGGEGDHAV